VTTSTHYIGKIVCLIVNGNLADSGNVDESACDIGYEFAHGNGDSVGNGMTGGLVVVLVIGKNFGVSGHCGSCARKCFMLV